MTGIIENAGSKLLTAGIVSLKAANPKAWAAFKVTLAAIAKATTELEKITNDDNVTEEEISNVLTMAKDYGAIRTMQDMLWGIFKHVRS
jgi:hypothetical protein